MSAASAFAKSFSCSLKFNTARPSQLLQIQNSCLTYRRLLASMQPGAEDVKPLEGIKILDVTRVLAGPFATMILGDLGAEVIKVERPGGGDDTRAWGPPFVGSESAYFLSVNRNKKSIAINMKDPRGVKLILELAEVCDVFVENYLPGKLAQMGLGYEDVRKVAPQLVYCSISGYGQTGPMSHKPGYDSIASAVSGMMHITGPEDGEPVRPGVAMTDLATGLYTHGAIMAALLQRQKSGRGLHIDCNLLSSQGFKTKDGYLIVAAGNDQQFVKVCKVLNLNQLAEDPKYKTNKLRVENRKELLQILSRRFSEKSTSDWLGKFEETGVPCGPINSIQQVCSDPQVIHNCLIQEMDHPTVGNIAVPGPAVRFSSFKTREPSPPPLIGQHTVQVLRNTLNYSDDAINKLLKAGTVSQNELQ
ncbi:succinate--hydroxymethylglutarate CoA-transferase isoform X2 [Conger conger]|uniref:succinate--hydroxymethylglutarate CoA-transferase isoform X2 n=1 Tax=Conger conger TaxID=82655 RepID=UPI002A5A1BFB|nr:succinate--hydroxymethylglutarate CoA-transferase isoform X2 [Conger conger]